MLFRRLVACLLVLGALTALTVPALGQKEKGKDKAKDKAKGKKDKDKDKDAEEDKQCDAPSLKWKFTKGKVFYQKMVTKTTQSMKVMNNDVNQTQNQTFYFSWTPTEVSTDKVKIEQKIIGVAMDI